MQITQQRLSSTVDTLNSAFSHSSIPHNHVVGNDSVDEIKQALAQTIKAYEQLYLAVREHAIELDMLEFLNSVRRIRNTNHCLRIHRDQFIAEANKYYEQLRRTYTTDLTPVLVQQHLMGHQQARQPLFEALHALQRTAAAFGVCNQPETYY